MNVTELDERHVDNIQEMRKERKLNCFLGTDGCHQGQDEGLSSVVLTAEDSLGIEYG
jgi:hypothetical protein